jgi:hypothetical protein
VCVLRQGSMGEATFPRSRLFDPMKHSFNPLEGIDYKRARELAELFYTISAQGDNTLTEARDVEGAHESRPP